VLATRRVPLQHMTLLYRRERTPISFGGHYSFIKESSIGSEGYRHMHRQQSDHGQPQQMENQPQFESQETITDIDITEPTLTWLQLVRPHQPIPIGDEDRVLESRFNTRLDCWEILLLSMPESDTSEKREADEE
jgi:hypothetical protein